MAILTILVNPGVDTTSVYTSLKSRLTISGVGQTKRVTSSCISVVPLVAWNHNRGGYFLVFWQFSRCSKVSRNFLALNIQHYRHRVHEKFTFSAIGDLLKPKRLVPKRNDFLPGYFPCWMKEKRHAYSTPPPARAFPLFPLFFRG